MVQVAVEPLIALVVCAASFVKAPARCALSVTVTWRWETITRYGKPRSTPCQAKRGEIDNYHDDQKRSQPWRTLTIPAGHHNPVPRPVILHVNNPFAPPYMPLTVGKDVGEDVGLATGPDVDSKHI